MSHEAPQTQTPEQISPSPDEMVQAFAGAQQIMYKLTADPAFHAACMEANINPYDDMDKPAYWTTLSAHAQRSIARLREKGADTPRVDALELLTATPDFLYTQNARDTAILPSNQERSAKDKLSRFGDLIRSFAYKYPETPVSVMAKALLTTANHSLEGATERHAAASLIQGKLRGTQHELAFGQLLAHTGRQFTASNTRSDLHGVDYVVAGDSRELHIDVKSSLNKIRNQGHENSLYSYEPSGTITMYSMVQDSDFHDRFFIPDDIAVQRAPVLDELLSHAEANRSIA